MRLFCRWLLGGIALCSGSGAFAGVVTFTDINAFRAAAGPLVEIDFSILPDGSQAVPGTFVEITPTFNYTDWGVTFLSPDPELRLIRDFDGSTLIAAGPSESHMWIEMHLNPAAYAIGVTTNGALSIYSAENLLLDQAPSSGFIGFLSEEPISMAITDSNFSGAGLSSVLFQPVPEPVTLILMSVGAWFVTRRPIRRSFMPSLNSLFVIGVLGWASSLDAGVVTFADINAFRAAAGPLGEIDFTVMPDGSPAPLNAPIDITPEFNFTYLAVTFLSPVPDLRMMASSSGGGTLFAVSHKSSIRNWIEAEFEPDVYAIGVMTLGVLSVYDDENLLVGEAPSSGFIGFLSDEPIGLGIIDYNSDGAAITSLLFQPVPEPVTLLLMGAGGWFVARRR